MSESGLNSPCKSRVEAALSQTPRDGVVGIVTNVTKHEGTVELGQLLKQQ